MKEYMTLFLKRLTNLLEYVIALILAVGILIMTFRLIMTFGNLSDYNKYPNYDDLLTTCFNLAIGIELVRMLYFHSPQTMYEVLLFAIARQIIIDHSSPINSLIGVVSIAILFATRKFLFVAFDESDKILFRASQKVRSVNRLIHLNLPYEENETLRDIILKKLQEDETYPGVGACVYFSDCALRIAKITDGKITRIEVIRSIH